MYTSFIEQKMLLPSKYNADKTTAIKTLEQQIAALEAELLALENDVNAFQAQIRSALSAQIQRIEQLTNLYKSRKQAKKLKRFDQKKRGKNYKEPVELKVINHTSAGQNQDLITDRQELKRLYKEAVVQIHPDKFADADDELNKRATAITSKLNEVYNNRDLEELNRLHEHIISGNALTYIPDQPETVNDLPAMLEFLQQKKLKLQALLQEIKASAIYGLFISSKDFAALISELRTAFENRIGILEKRTK